jgi:aldehyde:ferredoxin oxidoreductase
MSYLYEERLITNEDTGGMEIKDDFDTLMKLVRMTAHREGFGDILADGILGATKRLDRNLEKYAAHIKGYARLMDSRMYGLGTMQFSQIVNPRGSTAVQGGMGAPSYNPGWPVEQWLKSVRKIGGLSDDDVERIFTPDSFNIARLTKHNEDFFSVMNCLGLCYRLYIYRFYSIRDIADFYSAVTGIDITPAGLLKAGERAWNLYKLLNVSVGYNRKDDKPPKGWFTPIEERDGTEHYLTDYYRTKVLTKEDFEKMLDEYYDERGWDIKTGIPTPSKLEELGLGGLKIQSEACRATLFSSY